MKNGPTMIDTLKRRVADRLEGVVRRQVQEATVGEAMRQTALEDEVRVLRERVGWLENEMHRLGPFVAAQAERIGVLEQGYRPTLDDETRAAAVEHARARARNQLVSEYEERLNRLERQVLGASHV